MNHDAQNVRDRFWQDWPFLLAMARYKLDEHGLRRQHDPAELALHVIVTAVRQVEDGKLDVAQVRSWRAWATEVARKQILNWQRKRYEEPDTPHIEHMAPPSSIEEPLWERLDGRRREKLYELLPKPLRQLFVLRYEYDMQLSAAAAVADVSAKKARQMLDDLCRKVKVVERDGSLRGPDDKALTMFAHEVLALRDERSGRA